MGDAGNRGALEGTIFVLSVHTTILQVSARDSLYVVCQTTKEQPAPKAPDTGVALDDGEFC